MPTPRRQPTSRPTINARHPMARGLLDVWIPAISPLGLLGRSGLSTPGSGSIYSTPNGLGWNCTGQARKYAFSGFGGKAAAWLIIAHRSNAGGVNCSVARRGGSVTPIQEWDSNVNVAPFRSDGSFAGWTPYGNISEFQGKVNTFCGVISAKEKVIFSNGRGAINIGNVDGLAGVESGGPFTLGGNESDGEIASPYTILAAFLWSGADVPTSAQIREWSSNPWQAISSTVVNDYESVLLRSAAVPAEILLTGSAALRASSSGVLSTGIALAGGAVQLANSAGALTASIPMVGAAQQRITSASNLSTSIPLTGTVLSRAAATGDLSGGAAPLSGQASMRSTAGGELATSILLGGAAQSRAFVSGALAVPGAGLTGTAQIATSSAGLLVTGIRLAGAATAQVSGIAALKTEIVLGGAVAARVSSAAALPTRISLGGTVNVAVVAGGRLADGSGMVIDISKISPSRISVFDGSGSRVSVFDGSGSRVAVFEGSGSRVTRFQ